MFAHPPPLWCADGRGGFVHSYIPHLIQFFRNLQTFRYFVLPAGLIALVITTGCGSSNWSASAASQQKTVRSVADLATSNWTPTVLLFNGYGTSGSDVAAVESILKQMHVSFATANSRQLEGMSQSEMARYRLFLVPGGNSITIGRNLSYRTTRNVHNAVVYDGMHYLGICAGAFFGGYSIYNGLDLTKGVWFHFYNDYYRGIYKAAVEISAPNGSRLDQYWQMGPQLSGWGSIVGRYPNGSPAVVEGWSGKGYVVLSGVHPEAPADWRYGMHFTSSVAADNGFAKSLVWAAMKGEYLAHY
jgi:Biotin-protein ligase, N terminal